MKPQKNQKIALSIITVTYNSGNKIIKTINSVKKIKQNNFEYIILNGKIDEKLDKIVEENNDTIDIYVSEPDKGLYNAINKSIKLANGKYIHLLHAGDVYGDIECFGKIDFLLKIPFYAFSVRKFENNKEIIKIPKYDNNRKYLDVAHPGLIVLKEYYETVCNYREDFRISADSFFIHKNITDQNSLICDGVLVQMEPPTLSSEISWNKLIENQKALLGLVRSSVYLRIYFHLKLVAIDLLRLIMYKKGQIKN